MVWVCGYVCVGGGGVLQKRLSKGQSGRWQAPQKGMC